MIDEGPDVQRFRDNCWANRIGGARRIGGDQDIRDANTGKCQARKKGWAHGLRS